MILEVQRLAAIDDNIGGLVLLDVNRLVAHLGGEEAFNIAAQDIIEKCRRAQRARIWLVAPCADDNNLPRVSTAGLSLAGESLLVSTEPIPSLAYETTTADVAFTIVTARLDSHLHDLWITGARRATVLDLASGRLWSAKDFAHDPGVEPFVEAALRRSTKTPADRYRDDLRAWAAKGGAPPRAIAQWLVDGFNRNRIDVDDEERRLLGWDRPDPTARASMAALVAALPPKPPTSGYVCASVKRTTTRMSLERLVCLGADGRWHDTSAPVDAIALLRQLQVSFPDRWFGPQMLDLLAWMVRKKLPLPRRAIDPAWVALLVDPEAPPDLTDASPRLLGLGPDARAWLGDLDRVRDGPSELDVVARELRALDEALLVGLQKGRLVDLSEHDIGATLPVLAAIEERGTLLSVPTRPIAFADWGAVDQYLAHQSSTDQAAVTALLGPVNRLDAKQLVRAIERAVPALPADEKKCQIKDQIKRYEHQRPVLAPLVSLRSTEEFIRDAPLLHAVRSGAGSLHPRSFPQVNGRVGVRQPALQGLRRRGPNGELIRSALHARPGYTLIGCDYNGFEARIAADLSGDPVLVAGAGSADIFTALASQLMNTASPTRADRDLAKRGLLAVLYGQDRSRFWISLPAIPRPTADALYNDIAALLPTLFSYRQQIYNDIEKNRVVTTRGGWTRHLLAKKNDQRQRDGFNALVQGLAADIFRRVLRELHDAITPHDAHIVHHAFDEVFVEVPSTDASGFEKLVVDVMENSASRTPRLIMTVPLRVKPPRQGATWADLV